MHLHNHSQYSVIDGMGTIKDYLAEAKADSQESFALTDHGTLGGVIELYTEAKKTGVKPIIGMELYVDAVELRERNYPSHLTVLAKNESGYRALIAANNLAHRQFYYRPRITLQQIIDNQFAKDWFILSGCQSSPIYKTAQAESIQICKALEAASGGFFLEFMFHDSKDDEFYNKQYEYLERMADLHKQTGIPMVITNDCHYAKQHHEETHSEILATSQEASDLEFDGTGFHFKTYKQMQSICDGLGIPNGMDNAYRISKECNVVIPEADRISWYVPDITGGRPRETIDTICRPKLGALAALRGAEKAQEYVDRYDHEIAVLASSPAILNSYLVTHDVVNWCRQRGITVAARGSMAGSLVSYLLGITLEDPVKYRLSFSRAVNPARPTIPDFDLDCSSSHRGMVLDYLKTKYDYTIPIAAYSHFSPKGALRKVVKMEGHLDFQQTLELTKQVPEDWIDDDGSEEFPYSARGHRYIHGKWAEKVPPEYRDAVSIYRGLYANMSVHPSGLAISGPERPLEHEIPMQWIASSKMLVSALDMYSLKKTGMYKFDLLGLRTLDQLEYMEKVTGVTVPNDDYDDPEVLELFSYDQVAEIFQMDGPSCRQVIKDIGGIHHFEDIVAANTLARPGCAQFTPYYRGGYTNLISEYPALTEVLGVTNGLILYQEQVMEIARILADFTDAEQDDVKEAIKYFQHDVWTKTIEVKFKQRCKAKDIDPTLILMAISKMASYTYNRAHAMTYSAIAYRMMWYKRYHPAAYYAAVFDACDDKQRLIIESHAFKVKWSPPDVNRSMSETTLIGNEILLGLSAIKGVGPAAFAAIDKARPFVSEEDMLARIERKKCNSAVITKLKEGFALDSIGVKGKTSAFKENFDFPITFLDGNLLKKLDASCDIPEGKLAGFVTNLRVLEVKKGANAGEHMAQVTLMNSYGRRRCVVWPDVWKHAKGKIYSGAAIGLFVESKTNGDFEITGGFEVE